MYYFELFQECLPSLLSGLYLTVVMALASIFFAFLIGVVLGLFSISNSKALRCFSTTYIYAVRGVPLMILALFLYFGVSSILGIRFNPVVAAIISLTINASAYMAEIFRGGIESIPAGQQEAAYVLGLSPFQTFIRITVPQVVKRIIPTIAGESMTLVKDTALASVIGVTELFRNAGSLKATYSSVIPFAVAALFYLIMNSVVSAIFSQIEKKLNYYKNIV